MADLNTVISIILLNINVLNLNWKVEIVGLARMQDPTLYASYNKPNVNMKTQISEK